MLGILRSPWLPVALIILGVLSISGAKNTGKEFAELNERGLTAKAEVTKLEWREKKNSKMDSSYFVHLKFTTKDGRKIQGEKHVSETVGRAIKENRAPPPMEVRYLPESPNAFKLASTKDSSKSDNNTGIFMLVAGIIMLALRFLPKDKQS